jgi:SnoaL-like domain
VSTPVVDRERAADFVRRFEEFWTAPAPDRLGGLLAADVRLVAPLTPTTETLEDGERAFAAIFALVPDLTGEVNSWGATEAGVMIDLTVSGTAGGSPISWRAIDRISIGADGLATERVSYFDSLPLILTVARRPRVWPAFLRSRIGGRRG